MTAYTLKHSHSYSHVHILTLTCTYTHTFTLTHNHTRSQTHTHAHTHLPIHFAPFFLSFFKTFKSMSKLYRPETVVWFSTLKMLSKNIWVKQMSIFNNYNTVYYKSITNNNKPNSRKKYLMRFFTVTLNFTV